jgi:dihydrofolate reductase
MVRLIYTVIASLDGFVEDRTGRFEWAVPDDDVHSFVNDLMRPIGTILYGRRMYETMQVWETDPTLSSQAGVVGDFARIWQIADKIVFSRTLARAATAKTRIMGEFEPEMIIQLKSDSVADIAIGGPEIAGQAIHAGLVDEIQLFLLPVAVGGGKSAIQISDVHHLQLVQEMSFAGGTVFLRYSTNR